MAQKFTVEPTLQKARASIDLNDDSDSDSSDDEPASQALPERTPEEKKFLERKALKERLAREFEESLREAKEAADAGEGCTMCSS